MSEITEYEVVNAMVRYGGSFVELLGRTFQSADPSNFARLRQAFPEIWETYTDLARRARDQQEKIGR